MTDEEIETFAIMAARGDNIRKWPRGFDKDKKEYWREFVVNLADAVSQEAYRRGYADANSRRDFEEARKKGLGVRRKLGQS